MSNQENNFLIEAISPNEKWLCVFEDDGETGYLYFCPMSSEGKTIGISDALWIYNQIYPSIYEIENVDIIWSDDSKKAAFIVNGYCWGMFDLENERKLTAPRENNTIVTIPLETWNNGIPKNLGEKLNLEVK